MPGSVSDSYGGPDVGVGGIVCSEHGEKCPHKECYMPCDDPWCCLLYCNDCLCGPMNGEDDCECLCHADDDPYWDLGD